MRDATLSVTTSARPGPTDPAASVNSVDSPSMPAALRRCGLTPSVLKALSRRFTCSRVSFSWRPRRCDRRWSPAAFWHLRQRPGDLLLDLEHRAQVAEEQISGAVC